MTNNENTMKDIEFIYNDDSRLRLTAKSSIVMALNPDNNVVVAIKGMTPEIFGSMVDSLIQSGIENGLVDVDDDCDGEADMVFN